MQVDPNAPAVPVRNAFAAHEEHFCCDAAVHDVDAVPFAHVFEQAVHIEPAVPNVPDGNAVAAHDAQFCSPADAQVVEGAPFAHTLLQTRHEVPDKYRSAGHVRQLVASVPEQEAHVKSQTAEQ